MDLNFDYLEVEVFDLFSCYFSKMRKGVASPVLNKEGNSGSKIIKVTAAQKENLRLENIPNILPHPSPKSFPHSSSASVVKKLNDDLLEATKKGNLLEVKDLLAKGADPNYLGEKNRIALHVAAYYGHTHIASFLLQQTGIGIEIGDVDMHTPLHFACRFGLKNHSVNWCKY